MLIWWHDTIFVHPLIFTIRRRIALTFLIRTTQKHWKDIKRWQILKIPLRSTFIRHFLTSRAVKILFIAPYMALWAWMILPVLLYPLSCDIFSVAKELNVSVSNRNFLSGSHWYVSLVLKALFVIVPVLSRFIPQFRVVHSFQRSQTWCACSIWHFCLLQTLLPDPRSVSTYECCRYIYTQHPVFFQGRLSSKIKCLWKTAGGLWSVLQTIKSVLLWQPWDLFSQERKTEVFVCIFTWFSPELPSVFYSSSFIALS